MLIIYLAWPSLKILAQSDLVEIFADFGVPPPFFCLKIGFWLRGVKIFLPNLVHLFDLAFPENLSSIGLMVEAVDEFCGTGRDGTGRDGL